MKTFVLFIAVMISLSSVKGQFTQDFEGPESNLTSNCWTLSGVFKTTDPADVITGSGSMYTNPPTSGLTRDIISPALNITNLNLTVSFNYKVSSQINGNATRSIEVGLLNVAGNFTSLYTITLDKNSPTSVLNFNQTFVLASTCIRKLVLKLGGASGDGNSRLIVDDIYTNANAMYGTGTCNSAPVAVNDVFNGLFGMIITGNILSNDNEPDGEVMTPSIVATSPNGVVVLLPNGNFIFTPALGFLGNQTTFTYRLNDGGYDPLYSNTATVTLNYSNNVSLPVNLISFNAYYNKPNVNLNWSTAQEQNCSHFVIEKSIDGRNFTDAGTVFAFGNTTGQMNYDFTDNINGSQAGVIYYRLRSVDVDGKFDYSATRIIRIGKQTDQAITILTYPNPVINELRVTVPNDWQNKKVTFEIFSANGQVSKRTENANSGQTETLNVSNLVRGFYLVRASCEGQIAQQKIIKQ